MCAKRVHREPGKALECKRFPCVCKDIGIPGGAEGSRTPDLLIANEALYQLSYGPRKARNKSIGARSVKRVRGHAAPLHLATGANAGRTGPMASFIYAIVSTLLQLLIFAIIASAVLSWLVAFNVVNLRNQFVYAVARFLDAVTTPILRPFQKFIPPLGGVDITPIIVILVLQAAHSYLLPWLFRPLFATLG